MKRKTFVWLLLAVWSTLPAIARADNAVFTELIKSGNGMEKVSQPAARNIFDKALKKAQTDDERAQAQLGIARNTPLRIFGDAPDIAGVAKNAEFLKVLALPQAPATAKADAQLGMALVQSEIGRFESAVGLLAQVEAMPDATPEQKQMAQYWRGQILIELKQYDEAFAALTGYMISAPLSKDGKVEVWRHLARVHLAKNDLPKAKAVLALTIDFPNQSDDQIADIHIINGNFLSEKGFAVAAREEYSRVAILANANVTKNIIAKFQTGQTYFNEKNYAQARETWTPMLTMRGAENSAGDLWKAIGLAYANEKNYAAARDAYGKWIAVPGLDINGKVAAWQLTADSHVQEKNYTAAREALSHIGQGEGSISPLFMRMQLNTGDVYRIEGDFDNAVKAYIALLEGIGAYEKLATRKTSDQYTAENLVEEAAAAMKKEPASMTAAYTLYEAMEKHYAYDKEKAEANLGMGDILLAQGKRDKAKEKYQKAYELRKNYDEGKLAETRLKELATNVP